ncbi:bifunctional DNA-formamidopyrimidine glycosylase/DNA-(apurinic or apyrimidinic site) lyase [Oceanibacterium hippocampi]|uniref:Formamidopyrimidine-DNA glycosylase n=1 Tax=Oceanibacterium hippocampi TaxID=745714 RepID=A0A1Y5RNI3_9PROT|nr:bifunctional DNA-formamidopyrimidine glycosylase/DNA-(apurinic or apyrimidinic site) lyase [Oceanibacterium hippocampi]SLN21685.1 Formamidopyrimidine-DNA glycosylase [Oceanibacterium hippocampi]
MPELPEVETVCRGLAAVMVGRRLARVVQRRPDLRFPLPERFAERLAGRRVVTMRRRAKFILVDLDDGTVLIVHLGMSGRFDVQPPPEPTPGRHDHIVFVTEDDMIVTFNDHRRFGFMDLVAEPDLAGYRFLAGLGPEPLGNAFNGQALAAALAGRHSPIKAVLLDQRVVAGLGNIYVSEALHQAGISPRRLAANVGPARAERLAAAIRDVLNRAIAAGGSSLRDYRQASGELGYFQHSFAVYDRAGEACPSPGCGGTIRRIVQSGRSTYYCPVHQR